MPVCEVANERKLVMTAQAAAGPARTVLIEHYMPLIGSVARQYRMAPVERSELLQEGVVGLLRALRRYDPDLGPHFWPYASWWVRQAMQQLVSELARPSVMSDRALRMLARVKEQRAVFAQEHGRDPGTGELADESGLTRGQVERLLAADRPPRGLDEPLTSDGSAGLTVGDMIRDPRAEDAYERMPQTVALRELPVCARFGLGGPERSLRDIGDSMSLSAERIRQIEDEALTKLRAGCVECG
jgi:DNA-directed RNA polymerase sigma subunit (sigma70/sigma32)